VSLLRHILCVAPDGCFHTPREEILQDAGYAVRSFPSTSQALRTICGRSVAFDIVVVCDCIRADERARFIATVKATSPHTPVLVIGERRDLLADGVVSDHDGQRALLDHVAGLLV
jgi:DNA-binding NtrC family response regulator